jgi:hypothetical protein
MSTYSELGDLTGAVTHEQLDGLRNLELEYSKNLINAVEDSYSSIKAEAQKIIDYQSNFLGEVSNVNELGAVIDDKNIKLNVDVDTSQAENIINQVKQELEAITDDETLTKELKIEAYINTTSDTGMSLVDEFEEFADYVQSDYTYTIDEVQKLTAAGYGAMLDGATALADGTIKANEAI